MARHKLTAMRRAKMLTQADVAYRTGRDRTSISRYETGEMTPGVAACRALAQLYDVSFEDLWAAIESNGVNDRPEVQAGWWSNYEAFEQSAVSVRTWEPMVVPGLLQTEAYARVLLADEDSVAHCTDRQKILTRSNNPVTLVAVIDESVLHRPIGGRDVLVDQLRHLMATTDRPNVTAHVLPMEAEAKAVAIGGKGAFVILEPSWPGGLVHLEHTGGARSLDSFYEMEAHVEAFDRLRELALSPTESADRIRQRLKDLEP